MKRLVVAGLQTDYCVDTTCRKAASLGFDVALVGDAHTTFDHEDLCAEQIVTHPNRFLFQFHAGGGLVSVVRSEDMAFR